MKYLLRVIPNEIRQEFASLGDAGWRLYEPGLFYEHILNTFLLPMRRLVVESNELDLEAITGTRGYEPYSTEEFHDLFAEAYEHVLTNGDPSKNAVVFHTTRSKRIRKDNIGWYHPFKYNRHGIGNIPDIIQNEPLAMDVVAN
jgi:hypothetical protein